MSDLRLTGLALVALAVVLAGCDDDPGPILTPDGGRDAGQPDSGPIDDVAPRVVMTDPPDGTIGAPPNTAIEITFSEPMATASDDIEVRADGSIVALDPLTWDDGGRVLRAQPSAALPEGAIEVVLGTGFVDEAGNALAFEHTFSFEVRDATAPHVLTSTPAEGATDISARVTELTLEFDEPMDTTAGELVLGGEGTIGGIEWLSGTRARAALSNLANDTAYSVTLTGFADTAGNALDPAAYLGDGALDFTTRADDEGPRVIDASPAEGQVNVSLRTSAEIVVRFDEAMDTSITDATLTAGTMSATLRGAWSADATELRFPAEGRLVEDAAHALDLASFTDAAGNPLDGSFYLGDGALDFRTGADSGAPRVLYSDPEEGSSDRSYRQNEIVVVFDKSMDTSVTSFAVEAGARSFSATGSWNLSGTQLRLNAIGMLYAGQRYRIDLSGVRDATGNALSPTDPYLGDGALDFTLAAPHGEMCRDALTVAEASSPSPGVFVWDVAPTAINAADGSSSCDDSGIDMDGVIAYSKTTAAASAGGTVLRIRAESPSTSGLDVDVYANECDPTGPSAATSRLKCLWNNAIWEAYLDVGPGEYFVWFARNTGDFEGATITIEEVALPPEGESCANPLTTASASYTPPAAPGEAGAWALARDTYFSFDMDVTWGGAGSMSCDNDYSGGPIHGNDAVIRVPKTSDTSVLRVAVDTASTSQGVNLEVLDACDPTSAGADSLVCEHNVRTSSPRETFVAGPAGDYYAWLASDQTSYRFPGATVHVTEIEPVDGSTCSRARTIALGGPVTAPISADVTQRLYPPSCAASDATFTWYRFTAPENLTLLTANAAGTMALVDATSGRELACQADASGAGRVSAFVPAGTQVCVAIASGSAVTSLDIEPVPYDGVMGVPTDLGILRPLNDTGGERSITSMYWMTVTPTTIYAGISSTGLLVAPRAGGTRADWHDLLGAQLGYAGVSVGEAVFGLDDTSSTTGTGLQRLFRYVDPLGTFGSVSWDTGFAWPADSFASLAYDGTSLIASNNWASAVHSRFYSFSPGTAGPATLLGEHPTLQNIIGIAADDAWLYVQARDGTASSTEGVYRVSRADPTVAELLALIPVDASRAALALDRTSSPQYLYARDDDGNVHVFADPGGASPRHLGIVSTLGDGGDYAMAYDAVAGALILFESETVTNGRFVRLD